MTSIILGKHFLVSRSSWVGATTSCRMYDSFEGICIVVAETLVEVLFDYCRYYINEIMNASRTGMFIFL